MVLLIERSGVRFAANFLLLLVVVLLEAAGSPDAESSSSSLIGDDPVKSIVTSGEWTRVAR